MKIGAHVTTGGRDLKETALAAYEMGCETIQIFAANPNSWTAKPIDPARAAEFKEAVIDKDISPVVIHTQYLLNLASPDEDIYAKTIAALEDSLERAGVLNAEYVVTHMGSHKGAGEDCGIGRICDAVTGVLERSDSPAVLLLENSTGAGNTIGGRLEHLGSVLDRLSGLGDRLGVCLDTAHLWGAGYDISPEGLDPFISEFDSIVGMDRLKLLHLNDTLVERGSKRDRHANIGTGAIGEAGFRAILNHPALERHPGIIETPADRIESHVEDMAFLRKLRG